MKWLCRRSVLRGSAGGLAIKPLHRREEWGAAACPRRGSDDINAGVNAEEFAGGKGEGGAASSAWAGSEKVLVHGESRLVSRKGRIGAPRAGPRCRRGRARAVPHRRLRPEEARLRELVSSLSCRAPWHLCRRWRTRTCTPCMPWPTSRHAQPGPAGRAHRGLWPGVSGGQPGAARARDRRKDRGHRGGPSRRETPGLRWTRSSRRRIAAALIRLRRTRRGRADGGGRRPARARELSPGNRVRSGCWPRGRLGAGRAPQDHHYAE